MSKIDGIMASQDFVKTEWWLDVSALPDMHWAQLRVFANGTADVLDLDGRTHEFASAVEAANWLSEI